MPQPPIAPSIPPVETIDLMTAEGCALFGAVWRGKEAKLVECPALSDAMPGFRTAYDVDPYAGVRGLMIPTGRSWTRARSAPGAAAA